MDKYPFGKFMTYDHIQMPEEAKEELLRMMPDLNSLMRSLETAFSMGFYKGQHDIIEKATQILKASQAE